MTCCLVSEISIKYIHPLDYQAPVSTLLSCSNFQFFSHITQHLLSQKPKLVVKINTDPASLCLRILEGGAGTEERFLRGTNFICCRHDSYSTEIGEVVIMTTSSRALKFDVGCHIKSGVDNVFNLLSECPRFELL